MHHGKSVLQWITDQFSWSRKINKMPWTSVNFGMTNVFDSNSSIFIFLLVSCWAGIKAPFLFDFFVGRGGGILYGSSQCVHKLGNFVICWDQINYS